MVAVLNSTFVQLIKEFSGRVNFGLGALKTEGSDLRNFLVPTAHLIKKNESKLLSVFEKLSKREISSTFIELGANSPEEILFKNVKPDRLELDKIVLRDILGLSEAEHLEVYRAVVDLVRSRLAKAKSVGKKSSKRKTDTLSPALADSLVDDFENGN